jgi:hypothetical protein
MSYQPPSGFVEPMNDDAKGPSIILRFHTRKDCPRVKLSEALRAVDRPYSARRCPLCAPDDRARLPSSSKPA